MIVNFPGLRPPGIKSPRPFAIDHRQEPAILMQRRLSIPLRNKQWQLPLVHTRVQCRSVIRRRCYGSAPKSTEELRERAAVGPFTWKTGLLFLTTGVGLYFYFTNEKAKLEEKKRKETADAKVGKARIGGPFSLITHNGDPFSDKDLLGKWSLVYFGFTNCPDICPEELDKMSAVVNTTDDEFGPIVQPVFISCDPARDTVNQMRTYISDFHARLIGLTGSYDAVKATCKAYRVYFSTPPDAKPGEDYLVDHSIFFYLMDPEGQFVDAFGKSNTADDVRNKVRAAVQSWKAAKLQ